MFETLLLFCPTLGAVSVSLLAPAGPAMAARVSAPFEDVSYTEIPCAKGANAVGLQVAPLLSTSFAPHTRIRLAPAHSTDTGSDTGGLVRPKPPTQEGRGNLHTVVDVFLDVS